MRKEVIGDCTLFLEDCREWLSRVPECFRVDAVITDPPFGVGNFVQATGNIRGEKVQWNESIPSGFVFERIKQIAKYRVIWGANYFNCFENGGAAFVWVKNQPMPDFSKAEIASVSWGKKIDLINLTWTNFVNSKSSEHPCERPVALYGWCINRLPERPRSVLDLFMGSGSCGVACVNAGIPFCGIEIEPKYFDIACKRIEQAYKQRPLFEPEPTPPKQEALL